MKEDPSVFVDPVSAPPDQNRNAHAGTLTLDHYSGYPVMPIGLMEKYTEEKIGRSHVPYDHEGCQPDPAVWNKVPASNLFCHMTNYVAKATWLAHCWESCPITIFAG